MYLRQAIIENLLKSPMSLAEIQATTKASLPTVRRAVQALTDSHWISVIGQAEANGGRPAMLFGIDDSHYMIFGLQLQLPGIRLIATELNTHILEEIEFFKGEVPDPSQAVRSVADVIADIQSQYPDREALGIGIATPGFIDQNTGDIIAIGRVPTWENFPICNHLSELTGMKVDIANDVDCMAIAEFSAENWSSEKNLVYLGFCEGIKASLFLNGDFYKGTLGNVGLISPNLLNIGNLNNMAEMQQIVTSMGLSQLFMDRVGKLSNKEQQQYQAIVDLDGPKQQISLIIEQAINDKKVCYPIVSDLFHIISVATANLIHIIQPDEIIFGGLLSSMPAEIFHDLEKAVRKHIPPLISNNLMIKKATFASRDIAAIGATHHFLKSNLLDILKQQ